MGKMKDQHEKHCRANIGYICSCIHKPIHTNTEEKKCERCGKINKYIKGEIHLHTCSPIIQEDKGWEELFDKGFSFEGNNDPNDTPKMMFVNLHDHTKTIARPEYFKAFIRQLLTSSQNEMREKLKKEIIEIAEPYDGAKWHNNLSVEQVLKIITNK